MMIQNKEKKGQPAWFSCFFFDFKKTVKILLELVAKEAGDDDFGDMGCVGTTAAHTHHSEEEVLTFFSFGRVR